ncbi:MAG: HesA/MoeB/ThiF family protein [Micrococcales bacterium]|nr:HesA/MoeB/ThiF family protein [Micrococcales bacterium]
MPTQGYVTTAAGEPPADELLRAARTMQLPGVGRAGQGRIASARVLVVGAGGLGSPVLQYLAAAGVGVLGVADHDTVEVSNLARQVVHAVGSVGIAKVESATRSIAALNPSVTVVPHPVEVTAGTALGLLAGYDVVVDATDRPETRYLLSDAAAARRMPEVWGAVLGFEGQVSVFWEGAPDGRSIDYRDLHPHPSLDAESCETAGVLGPVCGVIGSAMAVEVLKLVAGVGDPLLGRVQHYDAVAGSWREIAVRRRADRVPVAADAVPGLVAAGAVPGLVAADAVPGLVAADAVPGRFAADAVPGPVARSALSGQPPPAAPAVA